MARFLIAVDVGNSRIKFGLFDRLDAPIKNGRLPRCLNSVATNIDAEIPWDEIRGWIADSKTNSVAGIVAGANPVGVQNVLETWPTGEWVRPVIVERPDGFPLKTNLDEPEKAGIDRLLNAVAANVVRPPDSPAVIVDCGTATTIDLVSADGVFSGGAILPGFELSARSLHHYTALLPMLTIDELASEPHEPLGGDTRAARRSGLFWGQLGAVKELVFQLGRSSAAQPHVGEPLLLLTGGGAVLLAEELPNCLWESHLSLQGLVLVAAGRIDG